MYNCTYIQNQNAIRSQHTGILGMLLTNLLSKCWACSIRNWLPCSHCLSSNWSKLWGMLPTAVVLLLFPAWLLVLLVELLAQLLLGIIVVPTVPLCADPPGTLFALRTCITAQSYSEWKHTDHVYGYIFSIPCWFSYLPKQWPGCVAVVQLVLQNWWNHWKCYEPPTLLTVYLTSFVPWLTMDSTGCQACVEHSHHSETCQQYM